MKKTVCLFLALGLLFLAACGAAEPEPVVTPEPTAAPTATPEPSRVLVVYFSRAGEQPEVGAIEKGNTAIVAECISRRLRAELYEIQTTENYYPESLEELYAAALAEQENKTRPPIVGVLPDLDEYDTVFIGGPVWHGDWPMIVYTYIEGADLSGKRVVPFCTSEGSGITALRKNLALALPLSRVEPGLAIRGHNAQERPEEVQETVDRFLRDLGFSLT
ncbi:MAG: flavodoxin [Oscillospiraceae bacterium]|nr:flavodoxin [Oscillospiraceae bacterium]